MSDPVLAWRELLRDTRTLVEWYRVNGSTGFAFPAGASAPSALASEASAARDFVATGEPAIAPRDARHELAPRDASHAPAPARAQTPSQASPRQAAPSAARASEKRPARALEVIQAEVASCVKCGLAASRQNTVFSRGNPLAKLVFVGEAPGADEDAQGIPFVGRAGQLLDKMIGAMGLSPENDVYVCNIIKCRPPENRRPEPEEIAACIPYLHEQLDKIGPEVIVALGNTAVSALLGTEIGITKVRGSWKLYRGSVAVMPTYHPSYLLRTSPTQIESKKQAWDDLQQVMKRLGLALPKRK